MRIRFLAAASLCAIALCATSHTSQAASQANHPANWAGYAVSGGTFTSASATWTAPSASNNGQTNSTSYTWVGVDGWANSSLLRVGIQQGWNASSHVAYHRAFWGLGRVLPSRSMCRWATASTRRSPRSRATGGPCTWPTSTPAGRS